MGDTSMRDGAREVAKQARPSQINPKLEEAVQNQPLLAHLLSFRVVLGALAIAAVVALILLLLMSPMFAGVGLFLVFFGAWFGLATLSYGRASEERASTDGESEDSAEDEDEG